MPWCMSFALSRMPQLRTWKDRSIRARDIALFELEMILSDLTIVEKRLERLERDTKKMKNVELEAEQAVLLRFKEALERESLYVVWN